MKNKKYNFFVVVGLVVILLLLAIFGLGPIKGAQDMRFGIDIRGGVEAIYEPIGLDRDATDDELNAARSVMEKRLDAKNILDREVTIDKSGNRIIVRFPWKSDEAEFDPQKAIAELGQTAKLTFRDEAGNVLIEGKDVKHSQAVVENNQYVVSLEFNSEGAKLFEEATASLIGKRLYIYMDETQISAPSVSEKISGGKSIITGNFDLESAKDLADTINSGALPFSMETKSHSTITPNLGSGALKVMVQAGSVAFTLICLFMLIYYKLPGFVSCIALTLQLAIMLLSLSIPQFTLTLPGIAGIILSLGMGVDANVIISERIGEEIRDGRSLRQAIKAGYSKAFSSVFDGNITTSIVAIILMIFGSGTLLSFGYTLLVGLILNFVVGVFSTQVMITSLINFKVFNNPKFFRVAKKKKVIGFYKNRWKLYSISIVMIAVGIASCFINGVQIDTAFKGGAMLTYTYEGELNPEEVAQVAGEALNRSVTGQVTVDLGNKEQKIMLTLAGNEGLEASNQITLDTVLAEKFTDNKLALSESYMVEPYIGRETLIDSIIALALALALIVVYVGVRFTKIGGISAGMMGLVALSHDVLIVFFTLVVFKIPLDTTFIAVALTIIGYSINDTVVIYDRMRENMTSKAKDLSELTDTSISETLGRSINTTVTTSISVLIMYVFAYVYDINAIETFALPMMVGVVSGCFSTVCLAGPLWVSWKTHKKRVANKTA